MADGTTKPIADIEPGDMVLAQDPETGKVAARRVTHAWVHYDEFVRLEIDGNTVRTTEDHPLWNDTDKQWQRADQLDADDMVLTADGRQVKVGRLIESAGRGSAYNLSVEGLHTYHVLFGAKAVLVHNTCMWDDLDALSASGSRLEGSGGLTRAGRKLEQHGGQGNLPRVSGNAAAKNAQGQALLDDILTSPGTRVMQNAQGKFVGGRTFIDTAGRGAVFDSKGVFQYFGVFK